MPGTDLQLKSVSMLFGSKYIFQGSAWYTEPHRDQKIYKDQILSFVNLVNYIIWITTWRCVILQVLCILKIKEGFRYPGVHFLSFLAT